MVDTLVIGSERVIAQQKLDAAARKSVRVFCNFVFQSDRCEVNVLEISERDDLAALLRSSASADKVVDMSEVLAGPVSREHRELTLDVWRTSSAVFANSNDFVEFIHGGRSGLLMSVSGSARWKRCSSFSQK